MRVVGASVLESIGDEPWSGRWCLLSVGFIERLALLMAHGIHPRDDPR